MRPEWQNYWRKLWKESKFSFLATLGVSFVFFAAYFPLVKPDEQYLNFAISFSYGLSIFGAIWILYALSYAFSTYVLIKKRTPIKFNRFTHLMIAFVGMGAGTVIGTTIKARLLGTEVTFSAIWFSILLGVFVALMFHFYYSFRDARRENLNLKNKTAEAELHVFKNQMQPHFLFNSLNSLLNLIETKDENASEMTMLLSELYREILENSKKTMVPLSSEISIVKKYLSLEKLRFRDRLSIEIKVPDNSEEVYLPPLVLQTLVENAIKHGISYSDEGGEVKVDIEARSGGYEVSVLNTSNGEEVLWQSGTGLNNSVSRLDLLYGKNHGFQINNAGNFVKASFWISGESHGAL